MSNYFFTSDPHFGHEAIIKYTNRPFKNAQEMDQALIENYNKVVKPNDYCFILGDLAFHKTPEQTEAILKKLNGYKILILGNHDRITSFHSSTGVVKVHYRIVELKGVRPGETNYPVTLCHYPMMAWNGSFHGAYHLHGHTHNKIPFDPKYRRLDVGVDSHNYAPISWDKVREMLSKVPTPKDQVNSGDMKIHEAY